MARAREEVAEILRLHGLGVAQAAIAQQLRLTKGIVAGVLFRARWGPELATADRAQPASPQLAIARAAAYHLAELERRLGWPAVMQTGCRFVIGDPREAWRWCGRRVVPGASWCAAHAAMLFDRKPRGEGAWEAQRVAWKKRGTDPNWW